MPSATLFGPTVHRLGSAYSVEARLDRDDYGPLMVRCRGLKQDRWNDEAWTFEWQSRADRILLLAVGVFGLCIIVFGFSKIYLLSFVALLLAGMVDGVSVVVRSTVLQLTTPDEMRGRVSAVNSMFVNSSNELGQFESGFTARIFGGAAPAVIFGGIMTLLVVIIAWIKAPALRKFEY